MFLSAARQRQAFRFVFDRHPVPIDRFATLHSTTPTKRSIENCTALPVIINTSNPILLLVAKDAIARWRQRRRICSLGGDRRLASRHYRQRSLSQHSATLNCTEYDYHSRVWFVKYHQSFGTALRRNDCTDSRQTHVRSARNMGRLTAPFALSLPTALNYGLNPSRVYAPRGHWGLGIKFCTKRDGF